MVVVAHEDGIIWGKRGVVDLLFGPSSSAIVGYGEVGIGGGIFEGSAVIIHGIQVAGGGVDGEPGKELVALATIRANGLFWGPMGPSIVTKREIYLAAHGVILVAPAEVDTSIIRA